jgi:hypothetical protein
MMDLSPRVLTPDQNVDSWQIPASLEACGNDKRKIVLWAAVKAFQRYEGVLHAHNDQLIAEDKRDSIVERFDTEYRSAMKMTSSARHAKY